MKNPDQWSRAEIGGELDQQVALAQLLLRNTRDLRACGLTQKHYDLMLVLKAMGAGEKTSLADLAAHLHSDPLSCAGALEQLRRRHLVRSRRPRLTRAASPQLTAKGEALLRHLFRRDHDRWLRLGPSLLASLRSAVAQEDRDGNAHDFMC